MEYYSGIHRKEWNDTICCNMDGLENTKWSQSDGERQILYVIYMHNLEIY